MIDCVIKSDCLDFLPSLKTESVDLVYLDPPFFTQQDQIQTTRDGIQTYKFTDTWKSKDSYLSFISERMQHIHWVLKSTGSVFFHCDRNATHLARLVLERIFGPENFRSEIIWHYRRWSNDQKNLLPAHQTILFFSKSPQYKFNRLWGEYSPTTNLDQIWQRRVRDHRNKVVYAKDENGNVVSNGQKKGVPLSDVWDIPYLNPKAKERVGYPTQKPLLLMGQIITLVTDPGDFVVDPFCGSGSTLVAAKLLNRHYLGIDISADAVTLSKRRLQNPVRSRSGVFEEGRESYDKITEIVRNQLEGLDVVYVQRNKGIDAFIKTNFGHGLIPIRVQRPAETIQDAISALYSAAKKKGFKPMIVIKIYEDKALPIDYSPPENLLIVDSSGLSVMSSIGKWMRMQTHPIPRSTIRETHERIISR